MGEGRDRWPGPGTWHSQERWAATGQHGGGCPVHKALWKPLLRDSLSEENPILTMDPSLPLGTPCLAHTCRKDMQMQALGWLFVIPLAQIHLVTGGCPLSSLTLAQFQKPHLQLSSSPVPRDLESILGVQVEATY